jgi:dihydropteroate synthase
MQIGNKFLDLTSPVVMTILNITPDSFYAESRRMGADADTLARAVEEAAEHGAAIIDVGGYSSRPGAAEVTPDEEFRRVAIGVEAVLRRAPQMIISVDTFRAEVVRRTATEFGAFIVNDISGWQIDADMPDCVAELHLPYILMHMRGTPADMQQHTDYDDFIGEVKDYFREKIDTLYYKGVTDIILDPGFGFAKSTEQNYRLLAHLDELSEFGLPILSGVSRKSMIYKVLDTTPAESLIGTAALNWESLRKGAKILRVHDTREAADIIRLYNAYTQQM